MNCTGADGPAARLFPVLALIASTALSACDATPAHLRRDLQERRLADAGVEEVDPSGQAPAAGLSALRKIDLPPIDPKRIGPDSASEGFHRLIHRCGTCHAAPSPKIRTAPQWRNIFSRMDKHMKEAGLIPLAEEDRALIQEFLERHAAVR